MNRALLHAAALALPLIGLGGMWLSADHLSRQGTEWDVPIQGDDPRDLLQGHYVQFQYEWPGLHDDEGERLVTFLCLTGTPPTIRLTQLAKVGFAFDGPARHADAPPADCTNPVKLDGSNGGRLYVSQAEAQTLQEKLWDQKLQGVVRIRLRPDGHITPLNITFRPRPPETRARPEPIQPLER
ncbi:MAG: GDYXXLXY domain-containing protein [Proteobacteria bacterium]|nr:GDYXXLXY domain-containing protein [Pseudomonadota bacterium]